MFYRRKVKELENQISNLQTWMEHDKAIIISKSKEIDKLKNEIVELKMLISDKVIDNIRDTDNYKQI
jgi:peptidoglycan hydrolase CwlO-like protein